MRMKWCLLTLILLLGEVCLPACGRTGFDPQRAARHYAGGELEAQYTVRTHGDFCAEYELAACMRDGVSTVTIIRPESVAGITATLQDGHPQLGLEDLRLDALLPMEPGFAPMDALHEILRDLREGFAESVCQEEDTVTLEYRTPPQSQTDGSKRVVLDAETLELLSAELYLEDRLLLSLQVTQWDFRPDDEESSCNLSGDVVSY